MASSNIEKSEFTLYLFKKLKFCAESKTFTQAAQKLNIQESQISTAIHILEALTGIQLLEKKELAHKLVRTTDLTPSGQKIYEAFCDLDRVIRTDLHPQITLYSLKALKVSSESKTFTDAAHKLSVLRPNILNSFTHLEKALNQTLFERTVKTRKNPVSVRTTRLNAQGLELLQLYSHLENTINSLSQNKTL